MNDDDDEVVRQGDGMDTEEDRTANMEPVEPGHRLDVIHTMPEPKDRRGPVEPVTTIVRGSRGLGMGGHHAPNRGAKDEWLTPPDVIEALGRFDLDPCAPVDRPWPTAGRHLTVEDDGLAATWGADEFVWLNPPYSANDQWRWLRKLADHPAGGIALIFARTETAGFFDHVWRRASSLLFIEGRLFFHHVDGTRSAHNSGAPSVLVGYGAEADRRLGGFSYAGSFVACWSEGGGRRG